jgi:hypothetical protein
MGLYVRKSINIGPFFATLAGRRPEAEATVARALMEWGRSTGARDWWGTGIRNGSFIPVIDHGDTWHGPFTVWTTGHAEITFQYYMTKPPFDSEEKRRELLNRLNAIDGVAIPEDAIARRPSVPLAALTHEDNLRQFLAVFDWFVEEVRRS